MPEISQEDLELFNKFKELGDPDAVAAALAERQTMARSQVISEAAGLVGFKPSVLAKVSEGVEIEVKDGVAMVGEKTLEDYANENWTDFLPALKSEGQQQQNGVPFVRQPVKPVTKPANSTQAETRAYLKRTYARTAAASN